MNEDKPVNIVVVGGSGHRPTSRRIIPLLAATIGAMKAAGHKATVETITVNGAPFGGIKSDITEYDTGIDCRVKSPVSCSRKSFIHRGKGKRANRSERWK